MKGAALLDLPPRPESFHEPEVWTREPLRYHRRCPVHARKLTGEEHLSCPSGHHTARWAVADQHGRVVALCSGADEIEVPDPPE